MITTTSGIYQWRNLIDQKVYIGSAVNLHKRKQTHLQALRLNQHNNSKLQRAFNKHGEENFKFEILEFVERHEGECKVYFKQKLVIEREQYYLNTLLHAHIQDGIFEQRGYNICRKANSTLGTHRSQDCRDRMRISAKKRPPISPETRLKHTLAKLGKKREYSQDTLRRVKDRLNIPIHRYSINDGTYIDSFESIEVASIQCHLNRDGISKTLKGRRIKNWDCVFSKIKTPKLDISTFISLKSGGYQEKNKKRIKCNYCEIVTNIANITKYHNENCKFKDKSYVHFREILKGKSKYKEREENQFE